MVHDPFRQKAVLIRGYVCRDRVQLCEHAALSERLVAVVGRHAVSQPAGKAYQDGLT